MTLPTSQGANKVKVSVMVDPGLEDRLHQLRGSGRSIKSLSEVARLAVAKGVEALEREAGAPPLAEAS